MARSVSALEVRRAYCSGNDRDVPVLVRKTFRSDRARTPSPRDAQALVCLDYGVRCTGTMCPLFSKPEGGSRLREALRGHPLEGGAV